MALGRKRKSESVSVVEEAGEADTPSKRVREVEACMVDILMSEENRLRIMIGIDLVDRKRLTWFPLTDRNRRHFNHLYARNTRYRREKR